MMFLDSDYAFSGLMFMVCGVFSCGGILVKQMLYGLCGQRLYLLELDLGIGKWITSFSIFNYIKLTVSIGLYPGCLSFNILEKDEVCCSF